MIRHPPRSTLDRWSAGADVYKRQDAGKPQNGDADADRGDRRAGHASDPVSYTHLRAHETVLDIVCLLLLEKKKKKKENAQISS